MAEKVRAHVRAQGYHLVNSDPDDATRARYPKIARLTGADGSNGYRTDATSTQSKAAIAAITSVFSEPPVLIRTMGGTLPIAEIVDVMGFPAIVVPTVNHDNNQHSDNENIRMGHFFEDQQRETGVCPISACLRDRPRTRGCCWILDDLPNGRRPLPGQTRSESGRD